MFSAHKCLADRIKHVGRSLPRPIVKDENKIQSIGKDKCLSHKKMLKFDFFLKKSWIWVNQIFFFCFIMDSFNFGMDLLNLWIHYLNSTFCCPFDTQKVFYVIQFATEPTCARVKKVYKDFSDDCKRTKSTWLFFNHSFQLKKFFNL